MHAMTCLLDGNDLRAADIRKQAADHRNRVARVRRWLWIKAWREVRKGKLWTVFCALWVSILIVEFLKWINV